MFRHLYLAPPPCCFCQIPGIKQKQYLFDNETLKIQVHKQLGHPVLIWTGGEDLHSGQHKLPQEVQEEAEEHDTASTSAVLQDADIAPVLGPAGRRLRVRLGGLRHAHPHAVLPAQHTERLLLHSKNGQRWSLSGKNIKFFRKDHITTHDLSFWVQSSSTFVVYYLELGIVAEIEFYIKTLDPSVPTCAS